MAPKTDNCDTLAATMRMMHCWNIEADVKKMTCPESMPFISNLAAKTKTSQLWNFVAVLSESVSCCNFPVKINKGWTEPVTTRALTESKLMQVIVHLVVSAPTGRRKSSVFNKLMEANIGCERIVGQNLVTQVCAHQRFVFAY
jgi:hypothetical protein